MDMNGKAALVTGGASGIGRATAKLFASKGASVAVADVDVGGGNETVDMITGAGGEAFFVACDVADEAQVAKMIDQTMLRYGRLDYAHNNAGIDGPMALIPVQDLDTYEKVVGVNLRGVFLGMQRQIPIMIEQGGGSIVNTASIAGLTGVPNLGPYSAAKHAVIGLSRTAALENATSGVRVNALCPGAIRTPMVDQILKEHPEMVEQVTATTPMGRLAEPEEMAEVAVWLCSDKASFVTGAAIAADGGYTAQ